MSAELSYGGAEDKEVLARLERQTLEENLFIEPITRLDAVWDEILGEEDCNLENFTQIYQNHPVEFVEAVEHLFEAGKIAAQKLDQQTFWKPSGQHTAEEISKLIKKCATSLTGTWIAGNSMDENASFDEMCQVFSAFSKEHEKYEGFIQGTSVHVTGLAAEMREMIVDLFKDDVARNAMQVLALQGDLNMIIHHGKEAARIMFEIGVMPKKL